MISFGLGAPGTRTSTESKWLRTYEALMCVSGTSSDAPGGPTFLVLGTMARPLPLWLLEPSPRL